MTDWELAKEFLRLLVDQTMPQGRSFLLPRIAGLDPDDCDRQFRRAVGLLNALELIRIEDSNPASIACMIRPLASDYWAKHNTFDDGVIAHRCLMMNCLIELLFRADHRDENTKRGCQNLLASVLKKTGPILYQISSDEDSTVYWAEGDESNHTLQVESKTYRSADDIKEAKPYKDHRAQEVNVPTEF